MIIVAGCPEPNRSSSDMELDVVGFLETDLHVSSLAKLLRVPGLILSQRAVFGNRDL